MEKTHCHKRKSVGFGLFLFLLIIFLDPTYQLKHIDKVLPPPQSLGQFHFGFQDSISDFLWVQFIQKAYDCSLYKDPDKTRCPYRWGYQMLDLATRLSPRYDALYRFGAVKLTVLLNDHHGAAHLLERGLRHYPEDWVLNYRASYVYMEELKKPLRAAELMGKAAKYGAPAWTKSLSSRLYSQAGRLELSYRTLYDLYEHTSEGEWKKELEKRLSKLEKDIKQKRLEDQS